MTGLYVLFDGYCNLCDGFVSFAMKHDKGGVLQFLPLQSEEGQKLLTGPAMDSVAFLENGKVWRRSDAALRVFSYLSWPWKAVSWLRIFPQGVRDAVYNQVARLRYRLFGTKQVCELTQRRKAKRE